MASKKNSDARANGEWQGMIWIRQEKRLAIYLRDGMACAYCGEGIEHGAKLTLDHITPHSQGGSNSESNLVTACHRCNSLRRDRSVDEFAASVAGYIDHGITADAILTHIAACTARDLKPFKKLAVEQRALRGAAAKAHQ